MRFFSGLSNYKGTPFVISDIFANIGNYSAGTIGSLFICRDGSSLGEPSIYQSNGLIWVPIGGYGLGTNTTLQDVTTNGKITNQGIEITAGGLKTNSITDTELTINSVPFIGTGGKIIDDNTNFVWDPVNKWLGIQTNTPTAELDLHSSTTSPMISINNVAGNASNIIFQNTNINKWRIGNNAANAFVIFNSNLGIAAFTIPTANNTVQFNSNISFAQSAILNNTTGYNAIGGDATGIFFKIGTSANTGYFNLSALTAARSYTLPNSDGTIALNPTGTINTIAKFITTSTVGNSNITDAYNGSTGSNIIALNSATYVGSNLGITASQPAGGPITALTISNGGSGYVDGTYTATFTASGQSLYASATFVISGGTCISVTLVNTGSNYFVGQQITTANTNLGGSGSGLLINVSAVDSSLLRIQNSSGSSDISLFHYNINTLSDETLGLIKWETNDSSSGIAGIQAKFGAISASATGSAYFIFSTRTLGTVSEKVRIDIYGAIGINSTSLNGYNLRISKNITGSINSFSLMNDAVIQSDVTSNATYFRSNVSTQDGSFTTAMVHHFRAYQSTIGVGSAITTQIAFLADSTLIGATNNYGFLGDISSGVNRWNLYMLGTASNYLSGLVGIGSTLVGNSNEKVLISHDNINTLILQQTVASDTGKSRMLFQFKNATNSQTFSALIEGGGSGTSSGYLSFQTNNLGTLTEALKISSLGIATFTNNILTSGSLSLTTSGSKINITTGTNASVGTATLVAGTIVVNTTAVTANSIILLTAQSGVNTGVLKISARTAGSSFTILSTAVTDTAVVGWFIIN